ncbi:MAG: hypothetical protein NVSMB9_00140 [Isosphaeraceae bacterium]
MATIQDTAGREPPARRLGILYIVSLSAVALLSVLSQALILRELSSREGGLPSLTAARQRSLERPLGTLALAFQTAAGPSERAGRLAALRNAVDEWEGVSSGSRQRDILPPRAGPWGMENDRFWLRSEPHRRAAIEAARAILSRSGPADVSPLVQRVLEEEEAYRRAFVDALASTAREGAARVGRLKILEFQLFAFVFVVLLLQGLCVVAPAVREIRAIFAERERNHAALKEYTAKLERSNRELQDFASVASHDLQEPLRKVQAFSDRLSSRYGGTLDDQAHDYLERIQGAAKRMQTLINDLLTYARVTTKAQPFVPVDLTAAARDVVTDLEVRIEQVGGRVELGNLPTVDADPLQVRQLMQNLIGNALKYHRPEAPPLVRVLCGPPDVGGASPGQEATDNGLCRFQVEDNGIGFEEIYSERIFTIFQRLHGRNEYEGTGIGLAVCRKIAERHGGSISARSTLGQGSTFTVTLPFRQAKEFATNGSVHEVDHDLDGRRRCR